MSDIHNSDFISEVQSDELGTFEPSAEDWAEYNDYLDEIGYDLEDDADYGDDDPLEGRGFQPWNGDIDLEDDADDEDAILREFGF